MPGLPSRNPYATHAGIVGAIAEYGGAALLADALGVAAVTVRRWRRELAQDGGLVAAYAELPDSEPWGGGVPPILEPRRKGADEVCLIGSDVHAPHHHRGAVGAFLALAREADTVVLNGDIGDFYQISQHNRNAERLGTLQAEIDATNAIRAAVRAAAPNARILETEGNHDNRLRRYIAANAPALASLRSIDPLRLFAWRDLDIEAYGRPGVRLRPHFLVKHGDRVRQNTGATARAELAASGVSGASGHTHRLGQAVGRTSYGPRLEWWEGGCLCQLDPDYIEGTPDWRHGALIVTFSGKSDAFAVEPVQAWDGGLRYGGRVYRAPA